MPQDSGVTTWVQCPPAEGLVPVLRHGNSQAPAARQHDKQAGRCAGDKRISHGHAQRIGAQILCTHQCDCVLINASPDGDPYTPAPAKGKTAGQERRRGKKLPAARTIALLLCFCFRLGLALSVRSLLIEIIF